MNVAHRSYLILFLFLGFPSHIFGMVLDNRYFPWLPHLYTAADHSRSTIHIDGSILTSSSAMLTSPGVADDQQRSGYPGFYGIRGLDRKRGCINMKEVGSSFERSGLSNPIPADWRYISEFLVVPQSSLQAQSIAISGYTPLTHNFGIGGSAVVVKAVGQVNLTLFSDTKDSIKYTAPGNQARFIEMMKNFEETAKTKVGYWKTAGFGDIDLYGRLYTIDEYVYACKKIDRSVSFGIIIPTGNVSSNNDIASVPFGGNGHWGWYVSPHIEAELKDDLKFGVMMRLQKRFAKTVERRIPTGRESSLFAPVIGDVRVNPGINFTFSPYVVMEDLRAGLGAELKYTMTWHDNDEFKDLRQDKTVAASFTQLRQNDTWVQEHMTIKLVYDFLHNKDKSYTPLLSFMWDIPTSWFGARGVNNMHRVSLGMTIDF